MPELFAQDGILRAHLGEHGAHLALRGAVAFGHGVKPFAGLVIRSQPIRPKKRKHGRPGGIRQGMGRAFDVLNIHVPPGASAIHLSL